MQKVRQKAESKKATDALTEQFSDLKNRDKKEYVVNLPISADAKALGEAVNLVKSKNKEKSVYLFAADKEEKVMHGCHVSAVRSSLVDRDFQC